LNDVGAMNHLHFGDNLDVLHRYVKDESVDLIYLDPPFNSNADYNVLFAEQDGAKENRKFGEPEIRCQFIILARKYELTPDFVDGPQTWARVLTGRARTTARPELPQSVLQMRARALSPVKRRARP